MKQPQLSVDLAPHEQQLGKYRLIARLGQGGMGTVYLALASGLGSFRKLLVVKELRHDLPWRESSLSMFLDEAQLAARLDHPNVLQTFEAGEANGRYYLAMEYLDGQPLSALIDHTIPLELHVYILCEVLQGLQYAHELTDYDGTSLHVVHRDVSPQNVFVTHHGQVKIVDFGVAKANIGSNITSPGVFKGKFAYAAPEQLLGRPVDGRCDVFAVGVMLWEAIANRRFGVPKPTVDAFRVRTQGLEPKISQIAPEVDPLLAEICDHALAVDPLQRVESAEALRTRLQEWLLLQGEHIQAKQLAAFMHDRFSEERLQRRRIIERAMVDAGASQSTIAALPRELLERESGMAPRVEADTGSESSSSSGISPSPRAHAHQPQTVPQVQAAPFGHEFGQPVHVGQPTLEFVQRAQPTLQPAQHFGQGVQQPGQKSLGQPAQSGIPALPVHLQTPIQPGHPHEFGQPVPHAQQHGQLAQPPQLQAAAQRRDDASQRMSTVSPSLAYAQEAMAGPSPRRELKPPSRLSSAAVLLSVAVGVFLLTYQLSRRATEPNNVPRLHPSQDASGKSTITTRSPATNLPRASEPAHDAHGSSGLPQPTSESALPGDSSARPHHGSSTDSTRERGRHEGASRDTSRDSARDSRDPLSRDSRDSARDSRDSLSRDSRDSARDSRDSLSRDSRDSARDSRDPPSRDSRDSARDSRDSLSRDAARDRDSLSRDSARDSRDTLSRDAARDSRDAARDSRDPLSRDSRDSARDSRDSARDSRDSARDSRDSLSRDAARDSRDAARDSRDAARDSRDAARDSRDSARDSRESLSRDAARDARDSREPLSRDARDSLSRDAARDSHGSLSRDAARNEPARDSLSRDAARDSHGSLSRDAARGESARDSLSRDAARDSRDSLSRDSATRDSVARDSASRHSARESGARDGSGSGPPAAATPATSGAARELRGETAASGSSERGAQRGAAAASQPPAANISKLTVRDFNIVTEGDPASKGTRARTPAERAPAATGKNRAGSPRDTGMGTDLRQLRNNGPSRIDTEDPYQ